MTVKAPNFSLAGKVALVTGAARGIGRACALACAAAGADVVIGVRNVEAVADLVAELESTGRRILAVTMDISDSRQITEAVAKALDVFGKIDVLVNNVGVAPGDLAELVTEKDLDQILDVNIKGTFLVTQAVARHMIERKSGRIINISSQAGTVTLRGEAIYCMSKAAINHLSRCLAAEWAQYGITVNTVAPTFIWTDGTRPALADPEFYNRTVGHIPLGRIGDTDDVVGAVVYLASPAAALVTGANLLVDGGWSVA
ncbi:NAD(P)-dependent dehydrogenase (short-subunit alcohol dehydrogenase family) [Rhizobium sp. BK313]|jgi:NAD(P)-dependent dehydrogenase (short-subunit alcohol dehydrogenase family)|uniref:SDR family NAD(P)-dependent oxidoreductase n=1 Tax=Rhizobium sp. BK313 TaxID=2587081 RepID=UPI001061BF19|nr:glucose 1-dehydrogenase [Rhizobium sp. BK313]MBB3456299.1 NAD(P)-dependent dehydrogenase (short-subunit alcohol dehydrogenase family) [Rhizobium sp. BK313]